MSMYVNITYRRGEVSNKGVQGRWLPYIKNQRDATWQYVY